MSGKRRKIVPFVGQGYLFCLPLIAYNNVIFSNKYCPLQIWVYPIQIPLTSTNKSKQTNYSKDTKRDNSLAMVDVSAKAEIFREATATGKIKLKAETISLIESGKIAKGDPLYTAKIAGVLAAKRTSDLIPLCHPLPLTNVEVDCESLRQDYG